VLAFNGAAYRHTHRHTSNENSISAIHSVHLAEILKVGYIKSHNALQFTRLHTCNSAITKHTNVQTLPKQCVVKSMRSLSAKLHYTDTDYGHVVQHRQRISSQQYSATCCTTNSLPTDKNFPHRNTRAQHLDMSRCWDVANFCQLVMVNLLYNKL